MGKRSSQAFRYFMAAAVPCLFLALGLVLPGPVSRWTIAGLSVVTAAAVAIMVSLLICWYFLTQMEEDIHERLGNVTRVAMMQADAVWNVWTPEQLSERERDMTVGTIWIVGRNFESEITEASPFLDVVRYNMRERKITYVYVVPADDAKVKHQFKVLKDVLGDIPEKDKLLKIVNVDTDKWERMPYTAGNVTIYDPSSGETIGYFWYPGGDGHQFGRLGREVVVDWISKIEELCPELKTDDSAFDKLPVGAGWLRRWQRGSSRPQ